VWTRTTIQVVVNGVLYHQVVDCPKLASYGINDYRLMRHDQVWAQETPAFVVGKIELDKDFEERETINTKWCWALDESCQPGREGAALRDCRYRTAGHHSRCSGKADARRRERRAVVAQSEGEREARDPTCPK